MTGLFTRIAIIAMGIATAAVTLYIVRNSKCVSMMPRPTWKDLLKSFSPVILFAALAFLIIFLDIDPWNTPKFEIFLSFAALGLVISLTYHLAFELVPFVRREYDK